MDNLINIFMNYKVKYFYNCTMLLYENNDISIIKVINAYFNTYIDNYYYHIFNTIEGDNIKYNEENLNTEFDGIEYDLIDEYKDFEDNIKELKRISLEIIKLDKLEYRDIDDIKINITNFFANNNILNKYLKNKISELIKLTKNYYNTCNKLLNYEDEMFNIKLNNYENIDDKFYVNLSFNSYRGLANYRKGMINKVFESEEKLDTKKLKCLIQKVSLQILRDRLNNEESYYFIDIKEDDFYKDKFVNSIYKLIDNSLFKKYVVLCVDYDTYLAHKKVFHNGFIYGCIQDFTRSKDIYKKTETIVNEGVFKYLIVSKYKDTDKQYFEEFVNDNTKVLILKED